MSTIVTAQTAEIVQVLCRGMLAFDVLLAELQSRFPATLWTSALLRSRLNAGLVTRLFRQIQGCSAPLWRINPRAILENASANSIYASFCPVVFANPCC